MRTAKPYDYTNYRAFPPRSILVLPPVNEGTDIRGTYGYLSTVTRPLAELGYYVYPVVLVDQFFKENGMPTPGEMLQAPLGKIREIVGADAVLYVTLRQYGTPIPAARQHHRRGGPRPARGHANGHAPLGGHAGGAGGLRRIRATSSAT